jgi:integrase
MAAIALWGAPLRIDNLRALRLYGERRSLFMSISEKQDVLIAIAREATKTNEPIRQRMRAGENRAVEILRWYIREIRPRFPGAQTSEYLFPGFAAHGGPIHDDTLRSWLKTHGRRIGIVMTPHEFRHGVASLYIRAHPGGFDHIARLLDNSPEATRKYYAWIDDERMLAEVQERLLKLGGFGDDAL